MTHQWSGLIRWVHIQTVSDSLPCDPFTSDSQRLEGHCSCHQNMDSHIWNRAMQLCRQSAPIQMRCSISFWRKLSFIGHASWYDFESTSKTLRTARWSSNASRRQFNQIETASPLTALTISSLLQHPTLQGPFHESFREIKPHSPLSSSTLASPSLFSPPILLSCPVYQAFLLPSSLPPHPFRTSFRRGLRRADTRGDNSEKETL